MYSKIGSELGTFSYVSDVEALTSGKTKGGYKSCLTMILSLSDKTTGQVRTDWLLDSPRAILICRGMWSCEPSQQRILKKRSNRPVPAQTKIPTPWTNCAPGMQHMEKEKIKATEIQN